MPKVGDYVIEKETDKIGKISSIIPPILPLYNRILYIIDNDECTYTFLYREEFVWVKSKEKVMIEML